MCISTYMDKVTKNSDWVESADERNAMSIRMRNLLKLEL